MNQDCIFNIFENGGGLLGNFQIYVLVCACTGLFPRGVYWNHCDPSWKVVSVDTYRSLYIETHVPFLSMMEKVDITL